MSPVRIFVVLLMWRRMFGRQLGKGNMAAFIPTRSGKEAYQPPHKALRYFLISPDLSLLKVPPILRFRGSDSTSC